LSRRTLLKAGAVAGAGLAAFASPLGAQGVALARYSRWLARQPLDTTQPITLRFMTRSGPGKRAFFKAAGDAFTKLHPNVTIHYEPHVDDWYTKLQVEIAGGAPPTSSSAPTTRWLRWPSAARSSTSCPSSKQTASRRRTSGRQRSAPRCSATTSLPCRSTTACT